MGPVTALAGVCLQDVERGAHEGGKRPLAFRLRPVSSKATHPPTYLPLHTSAVAGGSSANASAVAGESIATASAMRGGSSANASTTAGGASADASAAAGESTIYTPPTGGSFSVKASATGKGSSADASAAAGRLTATASTMTGGSSANASATEGDAAGSSETMGGPTATASTTRAASPTSVPAPTGGSSSDVLAAAGGSTTAASPTRAGSHTDEQVPIGGTSADAAAASREGGPPAGGGSLSDALKARGSPFISDVFKTANALRNALRDDIDDAVLKAGWKKCTMTQGGVKYAAFFQSAMDVALRVLRDAGRVQLRRDAAEVGDRREHPIDGEAFQAHQDAIDSISGGSGFVLGIYVYSDATLLSWSGGTIQCSVPSVMHDLYARCILGFSTALCLCVRLGLMHA